MTNKALEKNLDKVLRELKGLRRDMAMVLPTEKLSDYHNAKSIKAAFKKAMKQYPPKV